MDKDELIERAKDPRYIRGIYNYCDRWCERCTYTFRCLNYAIGEEQIDDPEANDISNEKFWQQLSDVFEMTRELIQDTAAETGIDISAFDPDAVDREKDIESQADADLLSHISEKYYESVDEWFDRNAHLFDQKEDEMNRIRLISAKDNPEKEAAEIRDVIDIIKWYQYQIHVKIRRALESALHEEMEEDDFPRDSDGSAKVSLLGIDRSIDAWQVLASHFQETEDSIQPLVKLLGDLRRRAETRFPNARSFIRPGFDEEP